MPIVPDTKNWTWVIERACPECGFDASAITGPEAAALIPGTAAQWPAVLARPDVRVRPDDSTWSALEYAAHVRDVFLLFRERLDLTLAQDDPLYTNWDQDETAVASRYAEQDPRAVAAELLAAAAELSAAFDRVTDWSRTARRSDGAHFTVDSFARYLIHDPVHHLWDVTRPR